MIYLRQNTAVSVVVGLFVDWQNSKSLLRDNADFQPSDITCELVKGITSSTLTLTKTGGVNDIVLTGKGLATLELTAANVDTPGPLILSFADALRVVDGFPTQTILSFKEDFMVMPAEVYDALIGGNVLPADVAFIRSVLEGDAEVDITVTPWQLVIKNKTTAAELIRKALKDVTGASITSTTQVIGQHKEPS
jgi:hypothetical protein